MIGTVNGLVFLPVLLSLAGPGPEVGILQLPVDSITRSLYRRIFEPEDSPTNVSLIIQSLPN